MKTEARQRTNICTRRLIFSRGVTVSLSADDGMALIAYGRFREAIRSFDRALAERPDDTQALLGKATALDRIGLFASALPLIERALDLEPMNLDAWFLQ